jgi:uncharacterized membrane protein
MICKLSNDPDPSKPEKKSGTYPPGSGIAIGIAIGVALGAAFNDITIGIGCGVAIGAGIDSMFYAKKKEPKP